MAETLAELIIREVKRRRILWDIKHNTYHNRKLVDRAWSEIAENVGETKETVKTKWKNLRDTFRKELKKAPRSCSGDGEEHAPRYLGSWPHYGAMLFLRESFQSFQLNASSDQPLPSSQLSTSVLHETCEKTRGTEVRMLQSNNQMELEQLENSFPGTTEPAHANRISSAASKTRNTMSSINFDEDLLETESKTLSLLRGQSDEDDEDMHFFKSLLPHVKQLPSISKLYFRSQVQNVLAHELSKI
ncbi:hypothetical protein B7P43_G15686 [Cryptotermes secundus]|uniref:MADF domain-containing protein n=1 Tax=Cryptotermes secundus TaxID=105785 RepID=A0A2J7QSW9_9NEOP|nr:hypothetical protein B7P43_G15686 [Cryptotermes secundus]